MKTSPTLAPNFDFDTYLVLDEFEKFRVYREKFRVYREVDEAEADRNRVIQDISNGQYNRPVRVVCFNTAEGWSRDVTDEIAKEIVERAFRKGEQLSRSAHEFVERVLHEDVPVSIAAGR
jgi:hypothetical protein